MILVRRPGMLTTLQDLGRWGHQGFGVPVAGPMDAWSHRLANALLGNPPHAAALEVTVTGPTLECLAATRFAITGAPFAITVSGETCQSPAVLDVARGTLISFGHCLAGARAYVAVDGGFDVPIVLGSRSTDLRAGFGGFEGRALRTGDRLVCRPGDSEPRRPLGPPAVPPFVQERPEAAVGSRRDVLTRLRTIGVPHGEKSAGGAWSGLLNASFRVSPRSDRMGYRLEGRSVAAGAAAAMITAPTVMGLVQVPPDGEPILLMADRQTTGGYAPVAVVIAADLPLAGQLAPGQRVAFEWCTHEAARRALALQEARLAALAADRA